MAALLPERNLLVFFFSRRLPCEPGNFKEELFLFEAVNQAVFGSDEVLWNSTRFLGEGAPLLFECLKLVPGNFPSPVKLS